MNPYVAFGLVMCAVVIIALGATAYMAVYFTRRAKADLAAALAPLAEVLNGSADVEEAQVEGRFQGKLSFGRMANAEGGPVRVFQTEVIDAAGGEAWMYVAYPAKEIVETRPEDGSIATRLDVLKQPDLAGRLGVTADWLQLEYSPDGGHVRLTVPMATRKDIPTSDVFRSQLEVLDGLSDENRTIQEGVAKDV